MKRELYYDNERIKIIIAKAGLSPAFVDDKLRARIKICLPTRDRSELLAERYQFQGRLSLLDAPLCNMWGDWDDEASVRYRCALHSSDASSWDEALDEAETKAEALISPLIKMLRARDRKLRDAEGKERSERVEDTTLQRTFLFENNNIKIILADEGKRNGQRLVQIQIFLACKSDAEHLKRQLVFGDELSILGSPLDRWWGEYSEGYRCKTFYYASTEITSWWLLREATDVAIQLVAPLLKALAKKDE